VGRQLRLDDPLRQSDVLPRPLQQRRLVDGTLPVVAQHERVATVCLSLLRLPFCLSLLDLLLQVWQRFLCFWFGGKGFFMDLGEE
jgi:hypothetical protein